ncbi:hypothetical protein H072_11479 [Dactylellina haptotyla CBS 200.50]|uniref:Major facilitator superfamily (MFS) profile domain-containing protein n=1 Tax=Dactylellina haptotyla (strain CBS 200.50) TaxID=1284197 RepID=S8BIZ7_DACHA|nr:hypothetical protein H072_11479 [Dactylellina haptotyla CBS 200.50]
MVLYGYDASVFNAVQGSDNWNRHWGGKQDPKTGKYAVDANLLGTINTAYTCGGIAAGWFFSAPISDRFGRRMSITIGCVLVIASTFIQAFAPAGHGVGGFLAGRTIVGFGQGIALPAGPVYIGELAPADIRGKIMSFWQMFYSVGSFIAFWINYACTKHKKNLGEWDWQMVVIFQIMVPLIIISLIWFCPETPRWFIQKGRIEEAKAALRRVRDTEEEIEEEVAQCVQAIQYEKESLDGAYLPLWKDKSLRKRLLLAFVINFGQQVTGQGSLNSYSTIVYKKVFPNNDTIQLINALNGTFGILFTLTATFTVDTWGRKMVLFIGAVGMSICMLISASIYIGTPTYPGDTKSTQVGAGIVVMMFMFAFFYKPSWGAVVWIWTGEVFSMNVRAQAVGMSSQMQNVGNLIVNQIFPVILKKIGFKAMYMFAGINVVLAIFTWFWLPETKNVRLEEMDQLFGGVNHIEKGANLVDGHQHVATDEKGQDLTIEEVHRKV